MSVHEKKKPFQCQICDRNFSRKGQLSDHIKTVHEKKKPFKCDLCTFCSISNRDLKGHIIAVHQKIKQFECEKCHFEFSYKDNLIRHLKKCKTRTSKKAKNTEPMARMQRKTCRRGAKTFEEEPKKDE